MLLWNAITYFIRSTVMGGVQIAEVSWWDKSAVIFTQTEELQNTWVLLPHRPSVGRNAPLSGTKYDVGSCGNWAVKA